MIRTMHMRVTRRRLQASTITRLLPAAACGSWASHARTADAPTRDLQAPPTDLKRPPVDLPAFIPKLTDADRQAAFPDLGGHPVSNPIRSFVLVERLEFQASEEGGDAGVNAVAWIGRDRNRLWLRAEGSSDGGRTDEAQAHVLWGRQFARWWDLVAGIRQDFQPGDAQTWAAVGVQGLSPYWFEIELTGYVGADGRTQARIDLDYELLLTNRWILQPRVEVQSRGQIGSGAATGRRSHHDRHRPAPALRTAA